MSTRAERLARIAQARETQTARAEGRASSDQFVGDALIERQTGIMDVDVNGTYARTSDGRKPRASHWDKRTRETAATFKLLMPHTGHLTGYAQRNVNMPAHVRDADGTAHVGHYLATDADGNTEIRKAVKRTPRKTRATRATVSTPVTRDAAASYSDRLARFGRIDTGE